MTHLREKADKIGLEHVNYEYWMAEFAYNHYVGGNSPQYNNAFLELFWLHANQLLDFLELDDPRKDKIRNQILTLTPARTAVMADKLQPQDVRDVWAVIVSAWPGKEFGYPPR